MTRNQIEYQKHLETGRHNQATEQETARNNRVVEVETNRHNLATELTANNTLTEANRHNRASERLTRQANKETKRSNVARELETNRHNLATESQAAASLDTQLQIANIGAQATKDAATISGQFHVAAAQIAADASKYAADAAKIASMYASQMRDVSNKRDNKTKKQIQRAADYARSVENSLDRAAAAARSTNQNKLTKEQNELEKLRVQIQEDYNDRKLTTEQMRTLTDIVNQAQAAMMTAQTGG